VLKLNKIALDTTLDDAGNNKHVDRLVALKHWAQPLNLPEGGYTVHVIEAFSPATAILDFARSNHVSHILIGAREHSLKRSLLGSVSGQVAAEANCTVTVVRPPTPESPEMNDAEPVETSSV
jgi:nucleotide-binding universal stress UspA family protein